MRILAVAYSARALAASVLRAGYPAVAADAWGDLDLRRLCPAVSVRRDLGLPYSPGALLAACRRLTFDAVIYGGALENAPGVVAQLAAGARLLGNPPPVLARARDLQALARAARATGVGFPRTLAPGQPVPAGGRWLCKRLASAGGAGVNFWRPGDGVPAGAVLQEYVAGRLCSALFVANGQDARLVALTEQIVGDPAFGARPFQYVGNIVPLAAADAHPGLADRLAALVRCLAADCGLVGLGGVDFVLGPEGPVALEVNPRYTAAVEVAEAATGQSLVAAHVAAVEGVLPHLPPPGGPPYWGKAVVYAPRPGRWRLEGEPPSWLRDVPHPGDRLAPGAPVCTVLARGYTREACLALLRERATAVRARWCQWETETAAGQDGER